MTNTATNGDTYSPKPNRQVDLQYTHSPARSLEPSAHYLSDLRPTFEETHTHDSEEASRSFSHALTYSPLVTSSPLSDLSSLANQGLHAMTTRRGSSRQTPSVSNLALRFSPSPSRSPSRLVSSSLLASPPPPLAVSSPARSSSTSLYAHLQRAGFSPLTKASPSFSPMSPQEPRTSLFSSSHLHTHGDLASPSQPLVAASEPAVKAEPMDMSLVSSSSAAVTSSSKSHTHSHSHSHSHTRTCKHGKHGHSRTCNKHGHGVGKSQSQPLTHVAVKQEHNSALLASSTSRDLTITMAPISSSPDMDMKQAPSAALNVCASVPSYVVTTVVVLSSFSLMCYSCCQSARDRS